MVKGKRWSIVLIQTQDGKLHEIWQWQLDYYLKYRGSVEYHAKVANRF